MHAEHRLRKELPVVSNPQAVVSVFEMWSGDGRGREQANSETDSVTKLVGTDQSARLPQ